MVIRRVSPVSVAKVSAALYGGMGLLLGACVSIVAVALGSFGASDAMGGALVSSMFGAAAIVVLPILYGAIGAIGGLITAVLYNLVAGFVGGIEIEVDRPV